MPVVARQVDRDEPRVGVAAVVEGPAGPITVVNTHLSFVPWWNVHQLRSLARAVEGTPGPLVLVGDLNMGPARAARTTGLRSLVEAPTFPVHRPCQQLDHVLTDSDLPVRTADARELPISDHRALVVELGLD